MHSENDSEFLQNYQKHLFQETPKDLFKTADVKRKCLTQTFKTSSTIFNNTATCDILDDMLSSYSELVDDQNGINNYADSLKVLTSHLTQLEYSKWETNIGAYDIKDFIKPLPCGDVKCQKSDLTEDDIKILFQRTDDVTDSTISSRPIIKQNDIKFSSTNFNNLPDKKPFFNAKSNNYNNNNSAQNTPAFSRNFSSNKINNSAYNSGSKHVSCKEQGRENVQESSEKPNMFKTARDELYLQNIKKYGKSDGGGQQTSSLNYGGQKRSLGTRRGVQSKFMPPIRTENNEGGSIALTRRNSNNNYAEETEEVDERLKNIDAKMVELICSEIMDSGPPITWDDIAGLEFAKTAIKEAVVWPLLRPDIFTGLRRPPKGILLFGPPGTGKTLIGKCIASQSQSTFFSISASSLTSKWIGDGEKMVRAMFAVARCYQPAVIFIDEIDSLLSQRSDTEHESSRRIKTEFLVQLDGAATAEDDRILLVGATNRPQELDEAARRRFVKRLYIPLPEKSARLEIVKRLICTEKNDLSVNDMEEIASLADGYSGADMKNLCSEASLGPIRSIDIRLIQNIHADQVRAITMDDFKSALNRVRASVSPSDLDQYVVWDKTYGSGGW